ncbi:hypothetical protein C8R43DRAFT_1139434 [Mycena crocata]|nr:hypothetical protein C8R43DRAFT_1139434 [Mycena crocata]
MSHFCFLPSSVTNFTHRLVILPATYDARLERELGLHFGYPRIFAERHGEAIPVESKLDSKGGGSLAPGRSSGHSFTTHESPSAVATAFSVPRTNRHNLTTKEPNPTRSSIGLDPLLDAPSHSSTAATDEESPSATATVFSLPRTNRPHLNAKKPDAFDSPAVECDELEEPNPRRSSFESDPLFGAGGVAGSPLPSPDTTRHSVPPISIKVEEVNDIAQALDNPSPEASEPETTQTGPIENRKQKCPLCPRTITNLRRHLMSHDPNRWRHAYGRYIWHIYCAKNID